MSLRIALAAVFACAATSALAANAPPPGPVRPAYGAPINLQDSKALVAAAETAAKGMNVSMAIAVVEPTGDLVLMQKMDGTQYSSPDIAVEKARSSARFRRPTKEFEDGIAGGRNALLGMPGALPIEGGIPILRAGKLIGALGISGGTAAQDHAVAEAALAAIR